MEPALHSKESNEESSKSTNIHFEGSKNIDINRSKIESVNQAQMSQLNDPTLKPNTDQIMGASLRQMQPTQENFSFNEIASNKGPLSCSVVAFNRDAANRPRYTIIVRFENQSWKIYRYYTDFRILRNKLEGSIYTKLAPGLPKKHPIRLKLRMKFLSKRLAQRAEMAFVLYRMKQLNQWLNNLLINIGPDGLENVKFLDDWFECFPVEEPYMQSSARKSNIDVEKTLYHRLKSVCCTARNVYNNLWNAGHDHVTISYLTRRDWQMYGVSNIMSRELYQILFKPSDENRKSLSPLESFGNEKENLMESISIRDRSHIPPPYSPLRRGDSIIASAPPISIPVRGRIGHSGSRRNSFAFTPSNSLPSLNPLHLSTRRSIYETSLGSSF